MRSNKTAIARQLFVLVVLLGTSVLAEETPSPLQLIRDGYNLWNGERRLDVCTDFFDWRAERFFPDGTAREFATAIEEGDIAAVDRLLDTGFDINHRGRFGISPLLFSLAFSREMTRHLLERGADPSLPLDASCPSYGSVTNGCGSLNPGATATQVIAGFGNPEDFQYILDQGVDPHQIDPHSGAPLIHFALPSAANTRLLLERGVDINQRNVNRLASATDLRGRPPFSPESLVFYLESGGDYRSSWRDRMSSLMLHLAKLKREDWGVEGDPWRPAHEWFENERGIDLDEILSKFQDYCEEVHDDTGILALAYPELWLPSESDRAARYFDDPKVQKLVHAIEADADISEIGRLVYIEKTDVNARGKDGVTPLWWATQSDLMTFTMLVLRCRANPNAALDGVFLANPNQYLEKGDTLVHWAARYGTPKHLRLALEAGGDPNARRAYSERTPIFDIVGRTDGYADDQAQVRLEDSDRAGIMANDLRLAKLVVLLRWPETDLNARDFWGRSPVMVAYKAAYLTADHTDREVGDNHFDTVETLLRFGASFEPVDKDGYDLVLQVIQAKRLYYWQFATTPEKRRRIWDRWAEMQAPLLRCMQEQGVDFELAEKTVWKGEEDLLPSIDLTKLSLDDRPWLPRNVTISEYDHSRIRP